MKRSALFPLVLVASMMVVSCRDHSTAEMDILLDEPLRIDLSWKEKTLAEKWLQISSKENELLEAEAILKNQESKLALLQEQKALLEKELPQLEVAFQSLREQVRNAARNAAIGKKYSEFSTKNRTYHEVTVLGVEDSGVNISHKIGKARLSYDVLNPEQAEGFGLDAELAAQSAQKDEAQQTAYYRWADERLKMMQAATVSQQKITAAKKPILITSANVAPVKQIETPRRYYVRRTRPSYYYVNNWSYYPNNSCNPYTQYGRTSNPSTYYTPRVSTPSYPQEIFCP